MRTTQRSSRLSPIRIAGSLRAAGASERGITLIEVLLSAALILIAAMSAVMYVTRGAQHTSWTRDRVFARQKALSMLGELRSYVEGGEGEVAADLDGFDDGTGVDPSLTISPDPLDEGAFLEPDHPISGNLRDEGEWRWFRRISVRPFPGIETRDLRICTVRVYRMQRGDVLPGEQMAEVSSVIRTVGDAYPTSQVYDVYLLALDSAPGWWVYMDSLRPFLEATLADLEARNPGLEFRTHWITKAGFGRDEEYAPYTNEQRTSRESTPWTYVYPGRMPSGESAERYYVPHQFRARMNLDGVPSPSFMNDLATQEPFTDLNGNGTRDRGEPFVDQDTDGAWDPGNAYPYALADMHNHCKRWPDATEHLARRVSAGLDTESTPTWRLLLDRMVANPDRYHNAILINLHGELIPMPPARNYSDAAKVPELRPGWRVVTHPERIRPARVAGNDSLSNAPRFRVYAYRTEFHDTEPFMSQEEAFLDVNHNGVWDDTEPYVDANGNGEWDAGLPISIVIRDGDFAGAPNDATAPSLRILRLSGGIDANGDGGADPYRDWSAAPVYPEGFDDLNVDGIRQVAEAYLDLDGNGLRDAHDPHQERDGDGVWTAVTETLDDRDGDGERDPAAPAEPYDDANTNGRWDPAEPYWDRDGNGTWTPPPTATAQLPWLPWDPADFASPTAVLAYIAKYGEPFADLDGDETWDAAESFFDADQNGVRDAGGERGEMWAEVSYDALAKRTVVLLHGTPLETPATADERGLDEDWRLYDLDYVPCPTPETATGTDRFERDLYDDGDHPKNTARWVVELPLDQVRTTWETALGTRNGDGQDRIVAVDTRIGRDVTTGVLWPARNQPQNLSSTYAYFYADPHDVPFSERYQLNGDPRHSPYADTDRTGTTAVNGYNWYFDDFDDDWLAFDTKRLKHRWKGRNSVDVPRLLSWLRTSIVESEAVYTTMAGFSYYYLSIGGDVGFDSANGFPSSIPMDGAPFGIPGDVYESTITPNGTKAIRGSLKYVRSNPGTDKGIRDGGYWWSKPWIGELFPDTAYATQWRPWGNLRAATGSNAGEFHLVKRGDITKDQLPKGTELKDSYARLAAEGCTSVFNIGTSSKTFHHQYEDGRTGQLVEDGPQLATNYNFPMPTTANISRPFGLARGGDGGTGDEFDYTDAYPRFSASMVTTFYDHSEGTTGCGLVSLESPDKSRGGYIVVNGLDRTLESGSSFIGRYSLLSLIHSFFAGGAPGGDHAIRQLPRVEIRHPTLVADLQDPESVDVMWSTEWARWDGQAYTASYPVDYAVDEATLRYFLLYSPDGGKTWKNMIDDTSAIPGEMPYVDGVGPDASRTLPDLNPGGNERFVWTTPTATIPEGSYLIRVEAYRATEALHYAQHMEKVYVNR